MTEANPTIKPEPFPTREAASEAVDRATKKIAEILAGEPRLNHYFFAIAADSADQHRTMASNGYGDVAVTIFAAIYTSGQQDAIHAKRPEK